MEDTTVIIPKHHTQSTCVATTHMSVKIDLDTMNSRGLLRIEKLNTWILHIIDLLNVVPVIHYQSTHCDGQLCNITRGVLHDLLILGNPTGPKNSTYNRQIILCCMREQPWEETIKRVPWGIIYKRAKRSGKPNRMGFCIVQESICLWNRTSLTERDPLQAHQRKWRIFGGPWMFQTLHHREL